jgi:hypothetical protein
MSDERNNAGTTRGRPFEPGNPGRPVGARHRVTRACEALLEGQHEELTQKAIAKALEGDTVALRLCLERLVPARKDAAISFDLPRVRTAAEAVEASAAVLAAVGGGDITPDEGSRVMALLVAHKSIIEVADLETRVLALEERTAR